MKSALIRVLFLLFAIGVFGDAKKAETVSVIEGDSVTLHTGVTEIQRDDDVEWRLNEKRIAVISDGSISTDVAFRDGLQLDGQTGDLKITNISTTDSGEYKLEIISATGFSEKIFSVNVVSVDDKQPSVLMGEYITLPAGVTNTQMYDVIQWKFGDKKSLIAEVNMNTGNVSYEGPDENFKGRLQLDYWTGSLTITNTKPKDSGEYEVDIISNGKYTIHKTFNVTVRGVIQSVSVKEGESTTLNTDVTELLKYDGVLWMFGDSVIDGIQNKQQMLNLDERFTDRLELNMKTGSLTITNTRTTDSGVYDVKVSSKKQIIHKTFNVTVTDRPLPEGSNDLAIWVGFVGFLLVCAVGAGVRIYYRRKISELEKQAPWGILPLRERHSLNPNDAKGHKDDTLLRLLLSGFTAERESSADSSTVHDDLHDGRFKGRLKLDHQTGSLTITDTTNSGEYQLLIIRPATFLAKRFIVSVFVHTDDIKTESVKEGDSVTLETGVTDVQTFEQILWSFGLTPLAEITREPEKIIFFDNEILKERLPVNCKTGSLTIKNSKPTDAGIYMLLINEGRKITAKLFRVKVESTEINKPEEEINNPEENDPLMRRDIP